jgi:hypothetical protein
MATHEDDILEQIGEQIREIADKILANPNADGWIRLLEILRKAEKDKRIKSSPGASEFLELTIELASDALTASTAEQAIEPLNHAMPLAILGGKVTNAHKARDDYQDKLDCQAIARAMWEKTPGATIAKLLRTPELAAYAKKYPGKNTLRDWLSEIDPRPPENKRGRPKTKS